MTSGGDQYDHFGYSVAVRPQVAVVGAYGHGGKGAAVVFSLHNPPGGGSNALSWDETQKLTASDASDNAYFGYSVAMNNYTIIVGAYRSQQQKLAGAGAVYIFERNKRGKYVQTHKLTSFVPTGHEYFGCAVASDGYFTLVGAYGNNDGGRGTNAGVVYVFSNRVNENTYTDSARLYASDASSYDLFGSAVALDHYVAVVGAHGDDDVAGTASGSAYVYRYNDKSMTWQQESKLKGSDASDYDYFGFSVAVYDGVVIVGAYLADGYSASSGAAYVFTYGSHGEGIMKVVGWYQSAKISPADGKPSTYFGYSVSLYKSTAIIGAYGDSLVASGAGSAYVYGRGYKDKWEIEHKMYSSSSEYDAFGCAVSIYEDLVIIGADMGDGEVTDSGTAYIFTPATDYSSESSYDEEEYVKYSSGSSVLITSSNVELLGVGAFFLALVGFILGGVMHWRRQMSTHGMSEVPVDSIHGLLGGTGLDVSNYSSRDSSQGEKKIKKKKKEKSRMVDASNM